MLKIVSINKVIKLPCLKPQASLNNHLGLAFDPSTPWSFIFEISSINCKNEMVGRAIKNNNYEKTFVVLLKKTFPQ